MTFNQAPTTVTFLITDIESSTKLWEKYPGEMKTALALHDAILRTSIESNRGQIIKTTGDGVHAGFPNALDAVNATLNAQKQLQIPLGELQIKVRMGVYTGEAEARAGDYYGPALNRAARLMSAAHGGQILLSNATAEILQDQLTQGMALRDLGEHRLKDLTRPEHIFQLTHPSIPDEFPPINSIDSFPNNLPVQLTSFIGREREIHEIQDLLNAARLVTLTGSGGTGKTRLSLEVGTRELASYTHGVWWIELAPLMDQAQIIPTIAQVFGLQELPFTSLTTLVIDYLRDKQALLLMDNCEHLIAACARLADDLLHQCKRLKILASSREALGIGGEASYRIPSLENQESIQLFVERARAVDQKFNLSNTNHPAIAKICARLDGIPLAIELASARAKLLSPEQIAARLDDRFRLLVGGSRTALPRQQTLRALIDWSYDLLSQEEKQLLRIASVFVGGWTLDALEAVAGDRDVVLHLEQLVNKSLVAAEEHGSQMRYSLLETIRQYAREKLLDEGVDETARVRSRHLDYFVQLTEASVDRLIGPEMIECLDELELEQDNLRAAIEWSIETNPLSALRMAVLLPLFWGRRLSASEGLTWVKTALQRGEEMIHLTDDAQVTYLTARAWALAGEATLAFQLGDNISARTAIVAAVSTARQTKPSRILSFCLGFGSTIFGFLGEIDEARTWLEEARTLARQHGYTYERGMYAGGDMFLAIVANQPVSPEAITETMRAARSTNNPWVNGMALTNVGRIYGIAGRWSEARSYLEEAAALFHAMRDKIMYNSARSEIGHVLRRQGNYSDAAAAYRETICSFQESGEKAAVAHELECFAFIAAAQGRFERAARLLGAAEALRELLNSEMLTMERREYNPVVSGLRAQMGEAVLKNAWAEGRALTLEQAIRMAVQ